jgi:ferredoxin-nitrate reductase
MNTSPVKTLCPYCGVGCGLEVVATPKGEKIRGDRDHPSSQGMICIKGATLLESIDKDRLLYPMMRENLQDPFKQASWEEVLDRIVQRIQTVQATYGSDGFCMYGSGQFVTEDYYVAQKLVKGCLGTNNFDANSRLCMSSAVSGYIESLGSDGPPCVYDDLDKADAFFLIGTNTAECHPIVFNRLLRQRRSKEDVRIVVVDPRCTETAQHADLHLGIRPGTDIDLMHGIAHLLLAWGKIDQTFIDASTAQFAEYSALLRNYSPDVVALRCGIGVEALESAARIWADAGRVLSLWSMGVNQSTEGTAKVQAIINVHLLTGQIGKEGAGPFSLTGQPNAMGGREAGGLAHLLPGYRSVKNLEHRAQVEQHWELKLGSIADKRGRHIWEMIEGLEKGEVGLFWVAATNPVVSLPDLERTKKALLQSPLTIYQDAYYPTETAAYAHILLPATQWGEKQGTMTNSERRVTLCPAFHEAPGEARDDWQIFAEVGRRLGFTKQFAWQDASEVYAEFAELTRGRPCEVTGINYQKLRENGPQQWPCSDRDNQVSKRLYTDHRFLKADGRAHFGIFHSKGLAEPPNENYPFVMTNGRLYGHWHTQTRTGRIDKIRTMYPEPLLEIHPKDAGLLELSDRDWVAVHSCRGNAQFRVTITRNIAPGVVFVPMHWGSLWADHAEANALTHPESDPLSFQPELKACAVQLKKI